MRKIYIVTHHDADGSCGAAIFYRKIRESLNYSGTVIDILVDDLSQKIDWSPLEGADAVFIVDHPYIPELSGKVGQIIWCDHHVNNFGEYDTPNLQGFRSQSMSGCELAWLFCYGVPRDQHAVLDYPHDKRANATIQAIREKAPDFVRFIGDNDNWDRKTGKSGMLTFICANAMLYNLKKKGSIEDWLDMIDKFHVGNALFKEVIKNGDTIQKVNAISAHTLINSNSVSARFKDHPNIKAILLNTPNRGSGMFESVKSEYDVGVAFYINKDLRTTMSFYDLTGKGKYNLGAIAKEYGGGGHKGAAGCTVNKITDVFEVVDE